MNDWQRFIMAEFHDRYFHPEQALPDKALTRIRHPDLMAYDRLTQQRLSEEDCTFIGYSSSDYPQALRHISQPPVGLVCKGNTQLLKRECIAIVGARMAHPSSLEVAADLGTYFANSKVSVISGGAFGCDIAAHRGCLRSKNPGMEITVFAGGLSNTYPKINSGFHTASLKKGGLWISEKAPEKPSKPYLFVQRNRIIAGISSMVILVQAKLRSGTMSTARHALDAGRDVFVLFDTRPSFSGNLQLIKDGAYAFESADCFFDGNFITLTSKNIWQSYNN